MTMIATICKDFFKIAFIVWLLLLFMELINPGMVQRFINLELGLYFLFIIYILNKFIDR
jgi:hypothetical protein